MKKLLFIIVILLTVYSTSYSQDTNLDQVKYDSDGYIFKEFKDKIIADGDIIIYHSGEHILYHSLIIKKGGVLRIIGDSLWWKNKRKFFILEVTQNLRIEGTIEAINWYNPIYDSKWDINIDSFLVKESFLKNILKYTYYFSKGGDGGKTPEGEYNLPSPPHKVPGGSGAKGSILFGGGGAGGGGFNASTGRKEGSNAYDYHGAPGTGDGDNFLTGQKGGDGGLSPTKGLGGLVFIICKDTFNAKDGKIFANGSNGNSGKDGGNTSNCAYSGGGGGGSAGLPGGYIRIIYENNIYHLVNIKPLIIICGGIGGFPGKGGCEDKCYNGKPDPGIKGNDGFSGLFQISAPDESYSDKCSNK